MSFPLTTGPSSDLDSTWGSLFIGMFITTFLQGVLTLQAYNYYENFPNDSLRIKLTVAVVWALDTTQLFCSGQALYHYLVTNWGFLPALLTSTWEHDSSLFFIGLSCFICQLFFIHRIWVFSNSKIIVAVLLALCLPVVGFSFAKGVQLLSNRDVREFGEHQFEITLIFLLGALADVGIAGCLVYFVRANSSGFESTNSMVTRVVRYTLASGLATCALGIAGMIAYFAAQSSFYFISIHFSLGRIYTNSLLATLNARKKIQSDLNKSSKLTTNLSTLSSMRETRYAQFPPEQHEMQFPYTVERTAHKDAEIGKAPGL